MKNNTDLRKRLLFTVKHFFLITHAFLNISTAHRLVKWEWNFLKLIISWFARCRCVAAAANERVAGRGGDEPVNMELTEDLMQTHSLSITYSMDCTINNHLPVCPDHLHQGYSLKLQVSFCFHFHANVQRYLFFIMHELEHWACMNFWVWVYYCTYTNIIILWNDYLLRENYVIYYYVKLFSCFSAHVNLISVALIKAEHLWISMKTP